MQVRYYSKEEEEKVLLELYEQFESGNSFEVFLRHYLKALGMNEITVTQAGHDGGVDLKCIRQGIDELGGTDAVRYEIQAKRYHPGRKIGVEIVRSLRGVMQPGEVGLIITTASFTRDAEKEAELDPSRQVVLIAGKRLLRNCIDLGIGFSYKPVLDGEAVRRMQKAEMQEYHQFTVSSGNNLLVCERKVTGEEIRKGVLVIPESLRKDRRIVESKDLSLYINGEYFGKLAMIGTQAIHGMKPVMRRTGLIGQDGNIHPVYAKWSCSNTSIKILFKRQ